MASQLAGSWFSLRALAATALLTAGCASARTAHIYEVGSGRSGVLVVEDTWNEGGRVTGSLPDGEECFGSVGDVAGTRTAVLTCGKSRVIQCTVASRETNDTGFGSCRDGGGKEYDVFF